MRAQRLLWQKKRAYPKRHGGERPKTAGKESDLVSQRSLWMMAKWTMWPWKTYRSGDAEICDEKVERTTSMWKPY